MGLNLEKSGKTLLPPTDGRIAIGRKNDKGFPTKLDYFIFTHPVDTKSDIAPIHVPMTEAMTKIYTAKPREIKVVLPFHHPDEVFFTSFADWKGRREWSCKSEDGYTAVRRQPNGSLVEVPCDYENCKFRLISNNPFGTTCRPNGILSVFILDAPVVGGVWKFRTNAWGSVSKIQKALEMMFNVRGSLRGLEVLLSVTMESQMVPDGKGGRQKQNVPVVQVKMPCSMRELALGAGTVYGDFKEIQEMARVRGNVADKAVTSELSMELSTPPSEADDNEEEISVDSDTNGQANEEPRSDKPSTSESTTEKASSTQVADDDLF
jgi:hypothetical protein